MAGLSRGRRNRQDSGFYWPGFVDAMAQLLLVITFLLSVFMITQFLQAREISGQDSALSRLRNEIAELTELLALEKSSNAELETTLAALTDDLKSARDQTSELQGIVDTFTAQGSQAGSQISSLQGKLDAEQKISADALARIELLNQQIAALRRQIGVLNDALDAAERQDQDSRSQIADLGRRLNVALAQRVQELNKFRSEFFGRLRRILADREDIRVVGDRFVFQSEVLFGKGEAALSPTGQQEIAKLALAMQQLVTEIPEDLNWVLQVDGHTDDDPINTPQFPSNWVLSSARAIAVVEALAAAGIPEKHLVAAGFGEFQPLDPGTSEEAKTRNRRIELKLTTR
ncbi:MAG: peptidoglycan -binding protein [Anderseniella sp.]|jgi:chemotaxis protein MotB|nr:peptidoglycan -binding protein [Anderseniella sp.]